MEEQRKQERPYVPTDPQARIVYGKGTPGTHSDGYVVVERARKFFSDMESRGLELSEWAVTDNFGNVACGIVAPNQDVVEHAAIRKFSDHHRVSKGRMVSEDAVLDIDWIILHCQTVADVDRLEAKVERTIAESGRGPIKRTTVHDLCREAGLPVEGPEDVIMMRNGGGHLAVNWMIDVDLIEGDDLREKARATISALADLGYEPARAIVANSEQSRPGGGRGT